MSLRPRLATVLNEWLDSRLLDVHTMLPGKVVSYDAATQTAEVLPLVKQSLPAADGSREAVELPPIPNVRVLWPRAGGCAIHFPMAAGDYVALVFSEAALGIWRETGAVSDPGDLTRHDLSYPYALPGGWPDADALPTDARPSNGQAVISLGANTLRVGEASGSQFVALANLVAQQLDALADAFGSWSPVPNDGGAALKTVLTSLLSSGWPQSVAATKLKTK